MGLIDADALERMGYVLTRTYRQDKETMVYETKKLSDVPSAQPEILACGSGELVQESDGLVKDLVKDCISRKMAIEVVEEYADRLQMVDWKENPCVPYKVHALNWCIYSLRELPSAQPERKKGKWIKISPANIYECSECGKNVMTDDISAYDFCHGCGARMDGDTK